jgi:hypothetical protein
MQNFDHNIGFWKKTANFYAVNCQKSKKIVIITSTPGSKSVGVTENTEPSLKNCSELVLNVIGSETGAACSGSGRPDSSNFRPMVGLFTLELKIKACP